MAHVTVTLYLEGHIDAADAIAAGSGVCGAFKLRLSTADVQTLSAEEADALERHLRGEPGWSEPLWEHAPRFGVANVATLRALLRARREWMAAQELWRARHAT